MDRRERPRQDHTARLPYHEPPAVFAPRSQFANYSRGQYQPTHGAGVPTYFSSPFRAPLNRQDRHDSLVEHQRTISHAHDDQISDVNPPHFHDHERSSYAFFEPGAMVDPLRITKKARQAISDADQSDGESQSSQDQPALVRQASIGHKAKPSLTNVKRSDSTQASKHNREHRSPTLRVDTNIDALNQVTRAAPIASAPTTKLHGQPESPTSMYSQDHQNNHRTNGRLGGTTMNDEPGLTVVQETLLEGLRTPDHTQSRSLSPLSGPTPLSGKSSSSTNPLLGLGISHQGMSSRVPEEKRPPKLNMKAVQELESRGSMTSLPDLIRRATRLAANLDRGKTASRLGMWDMLGMPDHAHTRRRESTFTDDVLDAFPDPAHNTPSKAPRPTTTWPGDPNSNIMMPEKPSSRSPKRPRKCCGLSMMAFMIVLVVIIIVIAAAVLIPIFLVAVPRQQHLSSTDVKHCSTAHPCQNKGISIVDNNACSCVCVNGFTGSDCSQSSDPNCVVADVVDGTRTFNNATLGDAIPSLLLQADNQLQIPLNASVVLSIFASNNLSCAAENSLVQFDLDKRRRDRRLAVFQRSDTFGERRRSKRALVARQTAYTSNDIVYQPTSTQGATTTAATASATGSTSSASPSATTNVTSSQLEFAQLVVLYVLAESRSPGMAVLAQQNIEQYFIAGALASGNSTVDVAHMGGEDITANFADLAIVLGDGKIVGGKSLTG